MSFEFVGFTPIPEISDQFNHLKTYFKNYDVEIKEDYNKSDGFGSINLFSDHLNKWIQTASDSDFEIVSNAFFNIITTLYSYSDLNEYDMSFLEKFFDQIKNQSNLRFRHSLLLYIFRNWWYANRNSSFSAIFFFFFLQFLQINNYDSDFMPSTSDLSNVLQLSASLKVNFNIRLLNCYFGIFNESLHFKSITFDILDLYTYCIHLFVQYITVDIDDHQLLNFSNFILSLKFASVCDPKSFLIHEMDERVQTILTLCEKVITCESFTDLLSVNQHLFSVLNTNEQSLTQLRNLVQIQFTAAQQQMMGVDALMKQLHFKDRFELEEFLFQASQDDIIKCKIDFEHNKVYFDQSTIFMSDVCPSNIDVITKFCKTY